jgi:hypothetical protein
MNAGSWFWIICVIAAIFGIPFGFTRGRYIGGGALVLFVLIVLVGWAQFGPPLK